MKEFIFIWRIENISYSWHKTGEKIISPIFYAGPMQNTAWTLRLFPRGHNDSDFLSLYLDRERDGVPINLAVNFDLSILSTDKSVLHSCFIPETLKTFRKDEISGFGESCFIKRFEVLERRKALYLPNDVLTLRCKMWKDEGNDNSFGQIFGLTRLTKEKIVSVENINPENDAETTFLIKSKNQKEALLSISVLYSENKIDVRINPISEENIRSSTCKLIFVNKRTKRKLCEHVSYYFSGLQREVWRLPFSDNVLHTENVNSEEIDFQFITEFVYSTGEEIKILEESFPLKEDIHSRNSEFLSNYMNKVTRGKLTDCPCISDDLWNLYSQQILCDVELKTETKSFFAHKFLLCARSPVFLSMLTCDMKEKTNACIEIADISSDILEKFLFFLYTDDFQELQWESVMHLYYAADKYLVEKLKLLCCSFFIKNIDVGNVCELLILADIHGDSELKREANNFIWKNEQEVFRSSMWKKFASTKQALALQTMLSKYEERENDNPVETYEVKLSRVPGIRDDFRSLLDSKIISDVDIKTDGGVFHAHNTVLVASSGSLRDAIINNLRSNSIGFFELTNFEADNVSQLLNFLYTDSFADVHWDTAIKLYKIAEIYKIQRLQIKCSCFFLENLSVSNAANILLIAHEQKDSDLKSVVEDFILMHDYEIFGSEEWSRFSKTNLLLAYQTICSKYQNTK